MATTAVSLEQYLHTSYRPDCDYVDGEVLERNLGEKDHSLLQNFLSMWFGNHRREWNILVLPEQRVQASGTRFRVPDVTLVRREDDFDRWVKRAPLACIEILSPEDRMPRVLDRLDDYRTLGVENIWVLDPATRRAWTYTSDGLREVAQEELRVEGTAVYLPLKDLWAELD